jgi:Saxitoxin biosynthesis operon protein SxtJ
MALPPASPARSARELRRFGLTVGGMFLLLGLVSRWRGHAWPPLVLGTAGVLLVVPGLLAPVERTWMRFAEVMGRVNGRIILTAAYYLVVTPVGIVRRWLRDPLDRTMRDGRTSVWVRRPAEPPDRARYRQQF